MNIAIYAIILGAVLGILKYVILPIFKGFIGEKSVAFFLSGLPENEYILINDVMLKTDRGSTQIDHVLLSIYGIFVIETKNYKGKIYGTEYGEQWTQYLGKHKNSFYNPIRQNYGHVAALSTLLAQPKEAFIPIVAFSIRSTLKVRTEQEVTYFPKIKKKVCKYKEIRYTEMQIDEFAEIIKNSRMEGNRAERKQHVKDIRQKNKRF